MERNERKAIYSSSGDRGLQVLLDLWPQIRVRVPDAELEVFYGLDQWKATADASGSQQQRYAVYSLERRLRTTAGVTYFGRINQHELRQRMRAAGVWCSPTWFFETSCISAMEAQAEGLRIVTSELAALKETVAERGVLLPGDWLSADYQARFVEEVVRAMTAPEGEWVITRSELQDYARKHFSWDRVALQWEGLFSDLLAENDAGWMPAYGGRA